MKPARPWTPTRTPPEGTLLRQLILYQIDNRLYVVVRYPPTEGAASKERRMSLGIGHWVLDVVSQRLPAVR